MPSKQIVVAKLTPRKRVRSSSKLGANGAYEQTPSRRRKSSARRNSRRASKKTKGAEQDHQENQEEEEIQNEDLKKQESPPVQINFEASNLLVPTKKKGSGAGGSLTKPNSPSNKRTSSVRCRVQRPSFRLMKKGSRETQEGEIETHADSS